MPLFPAAPMLALIGMAGVMAVGFADPIEGRPGLIAAALVTVVSVLIYGLLRWTGSDWRDRGPGGVAAARQADTDSATS